MTDFIQQESPDSERPPELRHILGWEASESRTIGFGQKLGPNHVASQPIWYSGTGHQITLGITGSGKAVNSAMPQALSWEGSLICFDPKGEIAQVTRRYREERLGQQIAVLSPFAETTDGLNPLDLAHFVSDDPFDFASSLATNIARSEQKNAMSRGTTNDAFWVDSSINLLTGLIGTCMEGKLDNQSLDAVIGILKSSDVVYNLATLLDKAKPSKPFYQEIAALLQTADVTRSGILSTAQTYLRGMSGSGVLKMLRETSFDLQGFIQGTRATTIYIIIPPEKLLSHGQLIRLLFGSLMTALFSRKFIPESKTLFQLDEAAALGSFDPLRMLLTLGRGQGVICHSFWQDLAQIKNNYYDWQTILNNHSVIRLLGASNHLQATEFGRLFGISPGELTQHNSHNQSLFIDGEFRRSRRLNYLTDSYFANRFEPNLRYVDPHRSPRGIQIKLPYRKPVHLKCQTNRRTES